MDAWTARGGIALSSLISLQTIINSIISRPKPNPKRFRVYGGCWDLKVEGLGGPKPDTRRPKALRP